MGSWGYFFVVPPQPSPPPAFCFVEFAILLLVLVTWPNPAMWLPLQWFLNCPGAEPAQPRGQMEPLPQDGGGGSHLCPPPFLSLNWKRGGGGCVEGGRVQGSSVGERGEQNGLAQLGVRGPPLACQRHQGGLGRPCRVTGSGKAFRALQEPER